MTWFKDLDNPIQVIFHNLINCAMEDFAQQVAATQGFSVEFEDFEANLFMSLWL